MRLLEFLCVQCGADEASGVAPDLRRLPGKTGKTIAEQVSAALRFEPGVDLIFVHRDADARSAGARRREIEAAAVDAGPVKIIPVVPIQETEAWLLLDEQAIRDVAENPHGKATLHLPRPSRVEMKARPKEILQAALIAASELKGQRLEKFRKAFGIHRALLLERVEPNGPIRTLSAWKALVRSIRSYVEERTAPT